MLDRILWNFADKKSASISNFMARSGMSAPVTRYGSYIAAITSCICTALQAYLPAALFLFMAATLAFLACLPVQEERKTGIFVESFFAIFIFFFMLGANQTSMATAFLILSVLVAHIVYEKDGSGTPLIGYTEKFIFSVACCVMPGLYALLAILMAFALWADIAKSAFVKCFKNKV
jgi:hypothetical protein